MSTRAIRAEIALQRLDPTKAYRHCDRTGRLIGTQTKDTVTQAVEEIKNIEPEKFVIKNALIHIEDTIQSAIIEEEVVNFVEEQKIESNDSIIEVDVPKRTFGKKKKVVSTDL